MKENNKEKSEVKLALRSLNALYAQVPEIVADDVKKNVIAAFSVIDNGTPEINSLISLQEELGYVKGEISTVAMLGLVGESCEVLQEAKIIKGIAKGLPIVNDVLFEGRRLEALKKDVRSGRSDVKIILDPSQEILFDKELADTYYYLQILATNRGLTIPQLAKMSHDKVREKQQAGGSSEDRK